MEKPSWISFTPSRDDQDRRVDRVLRKLLKQVPLSAIYSALRKGQVRINGKRARPNSRLAEGDSLEIAARLAAEADNPAGDMSASARPEAAGRDRLADLIVFENSSILACNKPAGMLTHGGNSLESAVLDYLSGTRRSSLSFTPGPMHRLDRNSSGLVLFPKTLDAARTFSRLQSAGKAMKEYAAVLCGRVRGKTRWEDLLVREGRTTRRAAGSEEGRRAHTEVDAVAAVEDGGTWYTLVRCRLAGGRTHQIRAQASAHGVPLEGDRKYGGRPRRGGYQLHAFHLTITGEEEANRLGFAELYAPPPGELVEASSRRFGRSALEELFGAALPQQQS